MVQPVDERKATTDGATKDKDKDKDHGSSIAPSFRYDGVPEERAWWISQLFYAWERPLFRRANKLSKEGRALEQDDLLPIPAMDHGDHVGPKFEAAWKKRGK